MLTKHEVTEKLNELIEPDYGISYLELQLIKDVVVKETQVSLTIVMITENDSLKDQLQKEAIKLLSSIGSHQVHVRFRKISELEYQQVMERVNRIPGEQVLTNHKEIMKTSLINPESGVKFIAIASGKGGVGKSTVTVNLAVELSRKGKRVGIIDADIYGFSIPDMMGIEDRPIMQEDAIIPVEKFGVKIMSMGFFVEENTPVIWRGPMLGKMLRNFLTEVAWGELDFMLLDLPPGTGDIALDVHQSLPKSKEIIVTTPHPTASFVAARAGAMALHTNHEILGIIENMSYFECNACNSREYLFGKGGGAKLAGELHTELLAQIPLGDPENHVSELDYSPSVYKPHTQIGQIYTEIVERILKKY